jgi:hypothetical protein
MDRELLDLREWKKWCLTPVVRGLIANLTQVLWACLEVSVHLSGTNIINSSQKMNRWKSTTIECSFMNCKCFLLCWRMVGDANEDRYHHLNHFAIFGGGYRGGAVKIMDRLIKKFGDDG